MRKRRRAWMASQMRATGVSVVAVGVDIIVGRTVMRRTRLRADVLQNSFDPVVTLDRVVVEEFQLGDPPQPQPLADLAAQEGPGAGERAGGLAPRRVVAEGRVVHACRLQVRRDRHVRDGEESDPRVVHLAGDELGELAPDLIADTGGTGGWHNADVNAE